MTGAGPPGRGRIGPTYDTLKVVVQPWPDRTTYQVSRIHHDGRLTLQTRLASGALAITPADLDVITPLGLLERVADSLRSPAQRAGSPSGDMGGQATLNLASRP